MLDIDSIFRATEAYRMISLFKRVHVTSLDSQLALPNTGQLNRTKIPPWRSSWGEEAAIVGWIIHIVDPLIRLLQHALTSLGCECLG
jgi:hypothetical protein